jgi:hypothetical protein
MQVTLHGRILSTLILKLIVPVIKQCRGQYVLTTNRLAVDDATLNTHHKVYLSLGTASNPINEWNMGT